MKTFISILIFVITLLSTTISIACSCYVNSFCETINSATPVFEVEVISKYNDVTNRLYVDLIILETLQNEITEDTISIAGPISSCEEPIDFFSIGDTFLINIQDLYFPLGEANYPALSLFSCVTNTLKLSNELLTGIILLYPYPITQNYDDFKNNLNDCNDLIASNKDLELLENSITISPNPFSENVTIDFGNLPTSKISIELFSAQGQSISSSQIFQQYNYKLPTSDFPMGIYFVKIQYRDEAIMKKIVKL